MQPTRNVKLKDLELELTCSICKGYLIDATRIIECGHAFCKSCIVKQLDMSEYCPKCEVQLNPCRPLESLASDQMLQEIVYKLIPGLFEREMERRRKFYKDYPKLVPLNPHDAGQVFNHSYITSGDTIQVSLELETSDHKLRQNTKRYFMCPATVSMSVLKRLIHNKFDLKHQDVDIFYKDRNLQDDFLIMDIAYKYSWIKDGDPLPLRYRIKSSAADSNAIPSHLLRSSSAIHKLNKLYPHYSEKRRGRPKRRYNVGEEIDEDEDEKLDVIKKKRVIHIETPKISSKKKKEKFNLTQREAVGVFKTKELCEDNLSSLTEVQLETNETKTMKYNANSVKEHAITSTNKPSATVTSELPSSDPPSLILPLRINGSSSLLTNGRNYNSSEHDYSKTSNCPSPELMELTNDRDEEPLDTFKSKKPFSPISSKDFPSPQSTPEKNESKSKSICETKWLHHSMSNGTLKFTTKSTPIKETLNPTLFSTQDLFPKDKPRKFFKSRNEEKQRLLALKVEEFKKFDRSSVSISALGSALPNPKPSVPKVPFSITTLTKDGNSIEKSSLELKDDSIYTNSTVSKESLTNTSSSTTTSKLLASTSHNFSGSSTFPIHSVEDNVPIRSLGGFPFGIVPFQDSYYFPFFPNGPTSTSTVATSYYTNALGIPMGLTSVASSSGIPSTYPRYHHFPSTGSTATINDATLSTLIGTNNNVHEILSGNPAQKFLDLSFSAKKTSHPNKNGILDVTPKKSSSFNGVSNEHKTSVSSPSEKRSLTPHKVSDLTKTPRKIPSPKKLVPLLKKASIKELPVESEEAEKQVESSPPETALIESASSQKEQKQDENANCSSTYALNQLEVESPIKKSTNETTPTKQIISSPVKRDSPLSTPIELIENGKILVNENENRPRTPLVTSELNAVTGANENLDESLSNRNEAGAPCSTSSSDEKSKVEIPLITSTSPITVKSSVTSNNNNNSIEVSDSNIVGGLATGTASTNSTASSSTSTQAASSPNSAKSSA